MEETQSEGNAVLRGRYELGRVLGHGTFAKVHLARSLKTGQNVAMKIMAKEKVIKVGMTEQIKREISIMKMVTHPNIVELHEVMATKSKIYFAMELVRGGELFARIARAGRLREEPARRYFRQLISAVGFCHSRGVYHRDLKPENLLLDEDGSLKVADFGLSAIADHARSDGLLHTACGTPAYVAPEVIGNRGYDGAKADVWSCGVILYVLLAGFLPFQADNVVSLCRKIQRGDFECPPWFSSGARRVVTRLLDPNPNTRMTIERLLNSSWFSRSSALRSLPSSAPERPVARKDVEEGEPETMNAFHLISLSEGFDLSPLFAKKEEGMRFATRETASSVLARLEEAAERAEGRFRVTKRSAAGVRLEGEGKGGKGRLAVAAEMFWVGSEVLVVEVKKEGGDTVEYRRFCSDELRPALKDIVWGSATALAS